MHPGRIGHDLHIGENPAMAQTFLNQFIKVQGNYLARNFRALGWVRTFYSEAMMEGFSTVSFKIF